MPVVRRAVLRRVLAHRRDDDAVGKHEVPQAERREHRRRGRRDRDGDAALSGRPSANQRSTVATKRGSRTLRFSWVTRRLRVRRLIANWMGSRRWYRSVVLEPFEAHLGRTLEALDLRPPLRLVGREGRRDLRVAPERAAEGDGVLHGELRPEPTEKCAVWAASPTSTTFPWTSARSGPSGSSARGIGSSGSRCPRARRRRELLREGHGVVLGRLVGPARRQVSSVVSRMNVACRAS